MRAAFFGAGVLLLLLSLAAYVSQLKEPVEHSAAFVSPPLLASIACLLAAIYLGLTGKQTKRRGK